MFISKILTRNTPLKDFNIPWYQPRWCWLSSTFLWRYRHSRKDSREYRIPEHSSAPNTSALRRSTYSHLPITHNKNSVISQNRLQPVCDTQQRPVLELLSDSLLDLRIRLQIHTCCSLIQTRTLVFLTKARAKDTRERSPTERFPPSSSITVSRLNLFWESELWEESEDPMRWERRRVS